MRLSTLPSTPAVRTRRALQAAPSREEKSEGQLDWSSIGHSALKGITLVTPPVLGGMVGGYTGAMAGGAASGGLVYALKRNGEQAALAALGSAVFGFMTLNAALPSLAGIGAALALGAAGGVYVEVQRQMNR